MQRYTLKLPVPLAVYDAGDNHIAGLKFDATVQIDAERDSDGEWHWEADSDGDGENPRILSAEIDQNGVRREATGQEMVWLRVALESHEVNGDLAELLELAEAQAAPDSSDDDLAA